MSLSLMSRPTVGRRLALAGVAAAFMVTPVVGPTAAYTHTKVHVETASVECRMPSTSALYDALGAAHGMVLCPRDGSGQ